MTWQETNGDVKWNSNSVRMSKTLFPFFSDEKREPVATYPDLRIQFGSYRTAEN